MKKIFLVSSFALVALTCGLVLTQKNNIDVSNIVETNAEAFANPFCENGCVAGKDGCYCYVSYKFWKEGPGGEEDK